MMTAGKRASLLSAVAIPVINLITVAGSTLLVDKMKSLSTVPPLLS